MGTFGTGILENDEAMDVYHSFEDEYFMGVGLEIIKSNILKDFRLVDDSDNPILEDNTSAWFAFALACWECQTVDHKTLNLIEKISAEEIDSDNWEDRWEGRKKVVERLLKKLSKPAKKLKPIPKFITPHIPIEIGECFTFKYADKKYGGIICLDIVVDGKKPVRYIYGVTRIHIKTLPTLTDFTTSHFLVYNYAKTTDGERANWINKPELKISYAFTTKMKIEEDKERIEQIMRELKLSQSVGIVKVTRSVDELYSGGNMSFDFSNGHENQFEWEIQNPSSRDLSYPVASFCELITIANRVDGSAILR
jgi:hypothetical protein